MIYVRSCPECGHEIIYKREVSRNNAETLKRACKSCTSVRNRAARTAETHAHAVAKLRRTLALLSEEVKAIRREKIRASNIRAWETLPTAFVERCLQNPEWHANVSKGHEKPCTEKRRRAISEGKIGMTYEQWMLVKPKFEAYAMEVRFHTSQQPVETLVNSEYKGMGTYHLDHKFSVAEGFRQNVPARVIGHIVNLEYITAEENLSKNKRCSWTLSELLSVYADAMSLSRRQALE